LDPLRIRFRKTRDPGTAFTASRAKKSSDKVDGDDGDGD
jgi:hypothetical protein